MKRDFAVVTIATGEKYKRISLITHPSIMQYANKINADFIVLDEETSLPHWSKFKIFNILKDYRRILYVDTDIIIRDDCPNLFDVVPIEKLGIFNEGKFTPRWDSLKEAVEAYNEKINDKKYDGAYYNTGVMVISRHHKELFKIPTVIHNAGMFEQPYLNLRIINDAIPVFELDYKFNRMTVMDEWTGDPRYSSYIIHYAGAPDIYEMIRIISSDLDRWNIDKPEYLYKRKILFRVGGGLGDQICSEPVIRYTIKNIYPNEDVSIASAWPDLFRHLGVPSLKDSEVSIGRGEALKILRTMPDMSESGIWNVVPHTLCHSVDFSSMATIHKILPDNEKNIILSPSVEGLRELSDIIGINGGKDTILVHPGRGWPSKTFPVEWWNYIINELHNSGNKVIVIGKHISKEQGYSDVDIPDGVTDLRDQLTQDALICLIAQANVLISNDSAPIHVAGATDIWIILIPTCKHPDHVLPYRNGSKSYKTISLYKKLTVDSIDNSPTLAHTQTLDYVPGDILDYLPEPSEVVECVLKLYKKEDVNV